MPALESKKLPWWQWYLTGLSTALFVVNLWAVLTWALDDSQIRAIFLAFTFVFAFSLFPAVKGGRRGRLALVLDAAGALIGLYVTFYIVFDFEEVFSRAGDPSNLDMVVALAATVLTLEVTRRTTGWALPILALVFLFYPLTFGPYLPGLLRTSQFSIERVMTIQYLSLVGIIGPAFKVMIEYIFLFIMFGAFLQRLGVTEFFIDVAKALAGNRPGGSAKIAVMASGLMGSVSGSATANVATTGVITIPMMRREGFTPTFAGAVEAAASTGGQLLPPVMGAAAFLMAEFTRTPYVTILKYALVPALLYYLMVWTAVHYQAKRMGMKGVPRDQLPALWPLLRQRGSLFTPLVILTWLIVIGYSPTLACIYAIAATIVVCFATPATRRLVTPGNILNAVRQGAESSVALFAASACAGIIVGVVTLTGLGLKISTLIIDVSQGYSIIALVLSAVTCIIFGLGLPTQIIYLTLAVLVAPGLVDMGIPMSAAHLFIMYFGMMSMVTPPVCFAAFAAAALSGAPMMQTGLQACKLAIAGMLVPFYFVYNPGLLLLGSGFEIAEALARALVGLLAAGVAIGLVPLPGNGTAEAQQKSVAVLARIAFAAVAVAMVSSSFTFIALGGGLLALALALCFGARLFAPAARQVHIGDDEAG